MKQCLKLALLIATLASPALAQYTSASAVLKDPSGNVYSLASYNFDFQPNPAGTSIPLLAGVGVFTTHVGGTTDSMGNLAANLADNVLVTPAGSHWLFSACAGAGTPCFTASLTITGATQDLTSVLQSAAAPLNPVPLSASVARLNQIRFADQFPGVNCGLKIAAACADFSGAAGLVAVNQVCGTSQWSDLIIPDYCSAQFIEGGSFDTGKITLGRGSSIGGLPCSMFDGVTLYCPVVLFPNTNPGILISGDQSSIHDISITGASQPSSAVGVKVTAPRASLRYMNIWEAPGDNLQFVSTGTSDEAASPKLDHVMSILAGGRNLYCTRTQDIGISNSEFQNSQNGNVNVEFDACGDWSFDAGSNIGGGTGGGFKSTGLGASAILNGSFGRMNGLNFGNNAGHDIFVDCWDSASSSSIQSTLTFTGMTFAGLGSTATDNNFDAIKLQDCAGVTVGLNSSTSITSHRYKYMVEDTNVSSSAGPNNISLNQANGVKGTDGFNLKSGDIADCNQNYSDPRCALQNVYFPNGSYIATQKADGTPWGFIEPLDAFNNLYMNIPTGASYNFLEEGSATLGWKVQAGKGTFNGGLDANSANVGHAGAISGATTLSMNNQLTNTLADGTAPLVVTSLTKNVNLNADMVDGVHISTNTVGHALCQKDSTHISYCTSIVASDGTCTCQ